MITTEEEYEHADGVLDTINDLAITLWEMMHPGEPPLKAGTLMRRTGDKTKTLAWDMACAAGQHLTDDDPATLEEEVSDYLSSQSDFCQDYRDYSCMAA